MITRKIYIIVCFFALLLQCNCHQKSEKKYNSTNYQINKTYNNFSYKPLLLIDSFKKLNISIYSLEQAEIFLLFIKEKDQEERKKFHAIYLKQGWVKAGEKINFQKNDSACRYGFDRIFDKFGFPDNVRFEKKIDSVVFLVLAHAPHSYRLKYIDAWEKSVRAKTSRADLFADIKDRVNIVDEGCQLYATQKVWREKDSCFLTICDLAKLNKKRKAIGLLPINLKNIKQSRY